MLLPMYDSRETQNDANSVKCRGTVTIFLFMQKNKI